MASNPPLPTLPSSLKFVCTPDQESQTLEDLKKLLDDPKSDLSIAFEPSALPQVATNGAESKQTAELKQASEGDSLEEEESAVPSFFRIVLSRSPERYEDVRTEKVVFNNEFLPLTLSLLYKLPQDAGAEPVSETLPWYQALQLLYSYLGDDSTETYTGPLPLLPIPCSYESLPIQFESLRPHFVKSIFQVLVKHQVFTKEEAQFFQAICGFKKNSPDEQLLIDAAQAAFDKKQYSEAMSFTRKLHAQSMEFNKKRGRVLGSTVVFGDVYPFDEMNLALHFGDQCRASSPVDAIGFYSILTLNSPFYSQSRASISALQSMLATAHPENEGRTWYRSALISLWESIFPISETLQRNSSADTERLLDLMELYCDNNPSANTGRIFQEVQPISSSDDLNAFVMNMVFELSEYIKRHKPANHSLPSASAEVTDMPVNKPLDLALEEVAVATQPVVPDINKTLPKHWKITSGDLKTFLDLTQSQIIHIEKETGESKEKQEKRILQKIIFLKQASVEDPPQTSQCSVILVFRKTDLSADSPLSVDFALMDTIESIVDLDHYPSVDLDDISDLPKEVFDPEKLKQYTFVGLPISDMRANVAKILFWNLIHRNILTTEEADYITAILGHRPISMEEYELQKIIKVALAQGQYEQALEFVIKIHQLAITQDRRRKRCTNTECIHTHDDADAGYIVGMHLKEVAPLLAFRAFHPHDGDWVFRALVQNELSSLLPVLLKLQMEPEERRKILETGFFCERNSDESLSFQPIINVIVSCCEFSDEERNQLFGNVPRFEHQIQIYPALMKLFLALLDKINEWKDKNKEVKAASEAVKVSEKKPEPKGLPALQLRQYTAFKQKVPARDELDGYWQKKHSPDLDKKRKFLLGP